MCPVPSNSRYPKPNNRASRYNRRRDIQAARRRAAAGGAILTDTPTCAKDGVDKNSIPTINNSEPKPQMRVTDSLKSTSKSSFGKRIALVASKLAGAVNMRFSNKPTLVFGTSILHSQDVQTTFLRLGMHTTREIASRSGSDARARERSITHMRWPSRSSCNLTSRPFLKRTASR